jgi:predicted PurR-regulated permease PerM
MLIAIGLGLATLILVELVLRVERVLVWIAIAAFFTAALAPAVDWVQRRMPRCKRSLATLLVFVLIVLVFGGLLAVFAVPLAREGTELANQLPAMVADARAGRGPVGGLLNRTHALDYLQQNQDRIKQFAMGLGTPALNFLQGLATGVVAALTIFVLAFLGVLQAPKLVEGTLALLPAAGAGRWRAVGRECVRTVTGYVTGNLIISVVCGLLTYLVLKIFGVPFAGLIALFVGIADLIPLVGATLGAIVAAVAAVIHSVPAVIAVVVFFVVYQQVENHLLQPVVFARTVKLNPLTVIVAILLATELAGILGALLAIPIAGIIQVVLKDIWRHHRRPATVASAPDPPVTQPSTSDFSVEGEGFST